MVSLNRDALTEKILAGARISTDDVLQLYRWPLEELAALANARRDLAKAKSYSGRGRDVVTYIIDRNINYTNVCNVYCKFCAFYRTERDEDHYVLSFEQLDQKLDELTAVGGVQILMQVAHELGLKSSATMMFGHVETIEDRVEHLRRIRDQQDRSGGFTAFICWTFQPRHTVLRVKQPTGVSEYLRMQALARVFLDNIENIQSSWVTQGPDIGQIALRYGANDFGSVMMEENVVSSAGTTFRLDAAQIESLIRGAGYEPRRRNNWYELLN